MVARTDDHDDHDSERCPSCRFKAALAEYLADLAAGREAAWHDAVGGTMAALTLALSALANMRGRRFAGRPGDAAIMAGEAAAALMTIANRVEELHDLLGDDDSEWIDDGQDDG